MIRNNSNSLSYSLNLLNITNYQNISFLSGNDSKSSHVHPEMIIDNELFSQSIFNEEDKISDDSFKSINEEYGKENEIGKIDKSICSINDYKIFNIVKINKKIGRIKKNSIITGKHNRLSQDNIIRQIKVRFQEKLRLYINYEYKKYILQKYPKRKRSFIWLKKINPKVARKIKKEDNLKWFQTKIKDIFSDNVSSRYTSYSPNSNKKKIDTLLAIKENSKIKELLNSNIETIFKKYVMDVEIEGFKTLKDDINELRYRLKNLNKENIEKYLTKYESVAKNMKQIFILKSPRNYACKKIKK